VTEYPLPQGQLSLAGPVDRPAVGTLPIRGDLAHIALADDRRERLIDVDDVVRQARHGHVWIDRLPRVDE
jgi:hypothetical protein